MLRKVTIPIIEVSIIINLVYLKTNSRIVLIEIIYDHHFFKLMYFLLSIFGIIVLYKLYGFLNLCCYFFKVYDITF